MPAQKSPPARGQELSARRQHPYLEKGQHPCPEKGRRPNPEKGQRLAARWSERISDACRLAARHSHLSRTGELILVEASRLSAFLGKSPTFTALQLGRRLGAHRRTIETQMQRLVQGGFASLVVPGDRGRGLASVWQIEPCGPSFAGLMADARKAAEEAIARSPETHASPGNLRQSDADVENARSAPLPLPVGERYRKPQQSSQTRRQYKQTPRPVPHEGLATHWEGVAALLPAVNRRSLATCLRGVDLPPEQVERLLERALQGAREVGAVNPTGYALAALKDPLWRESLLAEPGHEKPLEPEAELLAEAGIPVSVLDSLPGEVRGALPQCLTAAAKLAKERGPRSLPALMIHLLKTDKGILRLAKKPRPKGPAGMHPKLLEPFEAWQRLVARVPRKDHAGYLDAWAAQGEAKSALVRAAQGVLGTETMARIETEIRTALAERNLREGSLTWKQAWRLRLEERVLKGATQGVEWG